MSRRRCSRSGCSAAAVATLTYAYSDSTVVLGPLAPFVEPHNYDLCAPHSERLTVPLGWSVLRVAPPEDTAQRSIDDLEALANAVREAARPHQAPDLPDEVAVRRGHLRALPSHTGR